MSRISSLVVLLALGGACGGPGHHMLAEQLKSSGSGPILSVQGYMAEDGPDLEQRWHAVAAAMQKQPGFISGRLSAGVGDSPMWLAHSEWRSMQDLQNAFTDPAVLAAEARMPKKAFHHFTNGSEGNVEPAASKPRSSDGTEANVVLINPFRVESETMDEFVTQWRAAADFLRGQKGFVSTALHRSLAPDAPFEFVNIAVWETAADFKAAVSSPAFKEISSAMPLGAVGAPSLYRVEAR